VKADPARLEAERAKAKAYREANPEKIKRARRRYHLKRTPAYVEGYTRRNRDPEQAAKKRAQALARYYELRPVRPSPSCRGCGAAIAWEPPGRPPVRCDACVPESVRRRRVKARVALSAVGTA
jgi:hypothetical protein